MANRWQKLNYLVPGPKCRMESINGTLTITEWMDVRSKPSDFEIDAVTDQQAEDKTIDDNAEGIIQSSTFNKMLLEMNLNLENRVRTLEGGNTITKQQFVTYLKDLYKAL
jgi:hypothetical protein